MLKIQNLSYAYKKIQALKDVSFSLQDGEIMSIIGANGAGKSTLMKCIAGVLKTDSGSVILDDFPLAQKPHQVVRSGIVLVPEGRWIFPGLSVEENLNIGAYVLGGNPQGKERAFHMFPKLKERRDQRAGTLSGGEQQMLAIARGLMSNPKIIMLDEPSLGLAPLIVNDIFDIISARTATLRSRPIPFPARRRSLPRTASRLTSPPPSTRARRWSRSISSRNSAALPSTCCRSKGGTNDEISDFR